MAERAQQLAPVRTWGGRLPDFFLVGQPKSGTTALYSMLRAHPLIYMPDTKEPGFFASELQVRRPARRDGRRDPTTLDEYKRLFERARPEQRAGEATPFYLWSKTAAERIAEVQPAARIVATLREPASLLHSLHLLLVRIYAETETDFARALELEPARREGRHVPRYTTWPELLRYSEQVRYVEQLYRYEARFGRDQMLVLIYDDFRADNERAVRSVLRFLDVEDSSAVRPVDANPTVRVRSRRLYEVVHAVSVGHGPVSQGVKGALKAVTPRRLRRGALAAVQNRVLYADPAAPDEDFMAELRRRYRPDVESLSEYLDRDLVKLWGYDQLG